MDPAPSCKIALMSEPYGVEFIWGNMKLYFHFLPFLDGEIPKIVKSIFMCDKNMFILHYQCHGCWCPGATRIQGIIGHDIVLFRLEYSRLNNKGLIQYKDAVLPDGISYTSLWLFFFVFFSRAYMVNSLWSGDAIWWHRTGSTLDQVMAWCLTAPSHYLNQCWLIISKV